MWRPKPRVHPHAPVVALDIDGTLAAYHDHFIKFAEMYLQRPVKAVWTPYMFGEFSVALGLEKEIYRDIKLAYRQGGMKRSLPIYKGVQEMVRGIRKENYQVWICTTRPWLRLDNIDKDTAFWLQNNGVQFDGVLFGEDKYEDLVSIVGKDRIVCIVDDLPEHISAAIDLELPVALRTGDHNLYYNAPQQVTRVRDIEQMARFILHEIEDYEEGWQL